MIRSPYRYSMLTRWAITVPAILTGACAGGWLAGAYHLWGIAGGIISITIGVVLGKTLWRRR